MPMPSSTTRMSTVPPSRRSTLTVAAPASSAFSTSSLTAEAGRSTTSPAAILLTRWSGSRRMGMSLLLPLMEDVQRLERCEVGQIEARQLRQQRVGPRGSEETQLDGVAGVGPQLAGLLELGQEGLGPRDHRRREPREPRDLDAVASIGAAGLHLVEEHDLVVPLADRDVEVPHGAEPPREPRQLVEVRREQDFR